MIVNISLKLRCPFTNCSVDMSLNKPPADREKVSDREGLELTEVIELITKYDSDRRDLRMLEQVFS